MARRLIVMALLLTLLLTVTGCRFASEKYWSMPATYGLAHNMERGDIPEGWIQFYLITGIVDVVVLPITVIHDFFVLIFDPPHQSTWKEKQLERQMVHGY